MNYNKIEEFIYKEKAQHAVLTSDIAKLESNICNNNKTLRHSEQAREIIKKAGLEAQKQLQFHISDIGSLALDSIFEKPYRLEASFIERRNTTECDLLFTRDGKQLSPLDSSGYGAVDIASFALRLASWMMEIPKSNNFIILDEPFKFLSKDLHSAASTMIGEVARKLGLQFIIITHEQKLAEQADNLITIELSKKGISKTL